MAGEVLSAEEIFKEFKEHSISEFFRKNSQMLGYAGKVRSLTTIVHEYVTNSLDACEEAGLLPDIKVEIKEIGEERYTVTVADNGPGIPKNHIGKALGSILTSTKFHRNMQQRGQQGIGASGCTLYAKITTGKPIHVRSSTGNEAYECDVTIDINANKPILENSSSAQPDWHGLSVTGEYADAKYERSDHGIYEYVKRTALSNPHTQMTLIEPDGNSVTFPRSTDQMPKRPKMIKPHPLGLMASDLLDYAGVSKSTKLSSFLTDTFARVSYDKVNELKQMVAEVDFDEEPKELTWDQAEKLVKAFKQVKWIGPELDSLSTIGEQQIMTAMKNILNPEFMSVVERKPKVFRGGIPFVVEVGIAYGGGAGKRVEGKAQGSILRFANKVPMLFDGGSCAITEAVSGIEWKRYAIRSFDEEPVSVLVNVSSVYIPYSVVGKQAVAHEDDMIEEIRLAVMEAARQLERHLSNKRRISMQEGRYKTIMRYVSQLAADLGDITGKDAKEIEKSLRSLIEKKYKSLFDDASTEEGTDPKTKEGEADTKAEAEEAPE